MSSYALQATHFFSCRRDIALFPHIIFFYKGENFYLGQPEEEQPPNMH